MSSFRNNNTSTKMADDFDSYDESVTDSDILIPLDTEKSEEHSGTSDNKGEHKVYIVENLDHRTTVLAFVVMLVWCAASGTFLYIGITSAREEEDTLFRKVARDVAYDIESTMKEHEVSAAWIQDACRNRDMTFEKFNGLYDYLSSNSVYQYPTAFYIPNVTNGDRSPIEEETRSFLSDEHPSFAYEGFHVVDTAGNRVVIEEDENDKGFYMPIRFMEPLAVNLPFVSFDAWTDQVFQDAITIALEKWEATLTAPIPSESDEDLVSVALFHPGPPPPNPDLVSRDLGVLWISIPGMILSATQSHSDAGVGVFVFDTTFAYLGSAKLNNEVTFPEGKYTYESVLADNDVKLEQEIIAAGTNWTVVLIPVDGNYDPDLTYVIFGGGMIFVGSLFLAAWLYTNYKRAEKVQELMVKAKAENAIVSSLFPTYVRDRIIEEDQPNGAAKKEEKKRKRRRRRFRRSPIEEDTNDPFLHSYGDRILSGETSTANRAVLGSKPIADLFPNATIMFADLVGFTAWSSVREPAQVFTLLETLYHSFDMIAKKRRVFKVETIGDCYVAVVGLPHPRKDHAVVMARFASDCLFEMKHLVRALETSLGPDTGDLNLRVGLHSGEVTAGVLRGDKGRFQLFGDTMNTASRMESTGAGGMIQLSGATADLIRGANKGSWLTPREEKVVAKGKGEMQTYWLEISLQDRAALSEASSEQASNTDSDEPVTAMSLSQRYLSPKEDEKIKRLMKWNVEVLASLLRKIVLRRKILGKAHKLVRTDVPFSAAMPLDEVKEVITLQRPENITALQRQQDEQPEVKLSEDVMFQLEDYVTVIASMYHRNPFHNFEHASHVTMSVTKLLSRITQSGNRGRGDDEEVVNWHDDTTFGITADPMTQFACAFSALIHDVDHPGVPNSALLKEDTFLAHVFQDKSVAEQNSVEIGWQLLMGDEYKELQECIYCDEQEFHHFRSLVVNVVMATDVMDKELGEQRKARWDLAFSKDNGHDASLLLEDQNRKATIVLEHIIQASDVSHTMQHWHIYVKWNERLFHEMYRAFKAGRLPYDPSVSWYEGEKGFLDYYIIPLAKKLEACGVFGASSSEYGNYAQRNREEWEAKGQEMVQKYLETYVPLPSEKRSVQRRRASLDVVKGRPQVEDYIKRTSQEDSEPFVDEDFSDESV